MTATANPGGSRHLYMCESPNCPGDDEHRQRLVGLLTKAEYAFRTRGGRLLYCSVCTVEERPRMMLNATYFRTIPARMLPWL